MYLALSYLTFCLLFDALFALLNILFNVYESYYLSNFNLSQQRVSFVLIQVSLIS